MFLSMRDSEKVEDLILLKKRAITIAHFSFYPASGEGCGQRGSTVSYQHGKAQGSADLLTAVVE